MIFKARFWNDLLGLLSIYRTMTIQWEVSYVTYLLTYETVNANEYVQKDIMQ